MEGSTSREPAVGRQGGPYVAVATVCERVLQEQDGVLSVIRVIDRIIHGVAGPEAPDEMPPMTAQFTLLLKLRSGGVGAVGCRPRRPSGRRVRARRAGRERPTRSRSLASTLRRPRSKLSATHLGQREWSRRGGTR